jgi:hypothetical protein
MLLVDFHLRNDVCDWQVDRGQWHGEACAPVAVEYKVAGRAGRWWQ